MVEVLHLVEVIKMGSLNNFWNDFTGKNAADASDRAAKLQYKATQESNDLIEGLYNQNREDQMPWMQQGKNALGMMSKGVFNDAYTQDPGNFQSEDFRYDKFDDSKYQMPEDFSFGAKDFQEDPGAKYRLEQSQKALKRGAASMGGFASGSTLIDLMSNAGKMASQEFNNAYGRSKDAYNTNRDNTLDRRNFAYQQFGDDTNFRYGDHQANKAFDYNNYQTQRNEGRTQKMDLYNMLANLSGMGQVQSQAMANDSNQFGSNSSNLITGGANALAAGQVGAANAKSQGSKNILDSLMQIPGLFD